MAELAVFEKAITALKTAKATLDELSDMKWDQYGDDEENSYYSDMSNECSKLISKLTNSADALELTLNPV